MPRENIAARRQKLFCTVSGGGAWKQYGFEFQSRLQKNDRLNGIWFCDDMSKTTPLKNRGRNDIRVERRTSYVTLLRVGIRLLQCYSGLHISFWMVWYGIPIPTVLCVTSVSWVQRAQILDGVCWGDNLGCRGKAPASQSPLALCSRKAESVIVGYALWKRCVTKTANINISSPTGERNAFMRIW